MRHHFFASNASRVRLAWLIALVLLAAPAAAQTGRIQGSVRDDLGKPIRGAIVHAENPNAAPSTFTTTTDEKGRWIMLGLRIGFWRFTASAPGYDPLTATGRVEAFGATPQLEFTIYRGPGALLPGALGGVDLKMLQMDIDAADALFDQGKYGDAANAYKALLSKAPALTSLRLRIGEAQRLDKKFDEALKTLEEVPAADIASSEATREIGLTYLDRGDVARAEEILTKAAGQPNATPLTLNAAGDASLASGRNDAATGWFRKAAAADPEWPRPVLRLGVLAANAGDKAAATEYLQRVIALNGTSPDATQARSILEQMGGGR